MCEDCPLADIEGLETLIQWFGKRPCFHDSEVLALKLVRDGPSHILIHAWNTSDQVDSNGTFVQDRHAVVNFAFQRVTNLNLSEFAQNVISSLQVDRIDDSSFRLILSPCYGVSGFVEGERLSVTLEPRLPKVPPPDAGN